MGQLINSSRRLRFSICHLSCLPCQVLHGMEGLLNRTHGYPVYVYFEEQKRVLLKAGIAKQGENQAYLESFGYKCENLYNDVKCYKARANRNAFHSHYRF
jgi:hypothetical protein